MASPDLAQSRLASLVDAASPQGELLALRDQLGLPDSPRSVALAAKRGPGRPPGARNKRSESLVAQVERLFGNPVLRALAISTMPVEELAASLGISPAEALAEQRLWHAMALPYVASRMPTEDRLAVTHGLALDAMADDDLDVRLTALMASKAAAVPTTIDHDLDDAP